MVDRELHRRAGGAAAAQLDAARDAPQEFLDHRALRAARGARSRTAACCSTPRAAGSRSIFLILATGLTVDWSQRPEFAALKPHVRLWGDHFVPEGHADYAQADHPYVGPSFEFIDARPGTAPWVSRIHCFNYPGHLSHGPISGDIPAISTGAERVATRRRDRAVRRGL